ncbi:MAG: uroporphyrinogen-III C-methyltransferase [Thermodesulfobacteriaceae bacterium]|jgi:uroporphyrinogen III methyltransferase/synthase
MSKKGKVYLVGAGPGDPGLITIKGLKVLEKADTVIYDYLANPELLSYCREDVELIYVGKKGGNHTMSQEEINKLLAKKALEGKLVVRLKGGDPFLFGRGGEEIEELIKHGIPFEVIPGVTSAIAVPAYAGIPVTHRNFTSTLAIVTGHEAEGKRESKIDFSALAKLGTLIFLMGVKNLPHIVENLIKEGKSQDTPCAVIQWGTTPKQKVATGTLENIVDKVAEAGITAPAIIVVGEVVSLREKLKWFETKPLFGKRILVTRTREQASKLKEALVELGAQVFEVPTIKVEYILNGETLTKLKELPRYDWLVFTSENGVIAFFSALAKLDLDLRFIANQKIAVIGPGTESALKKYIIKPDLRPEKDYTQEGLLAAFSLVDLKGKRVLLIRAKVARDVLPKGLAELGANVEILPIYETKLPEESKEKLVLILRQGVDVITFTSSSTVENFFKLLEGTEVKLSKVLFAVIGPITANTLRQYGFEPEIIAKENTIQGLVSAILEYFQKQ